MLHTLQVAPQTVGYAGASFQMTILIGSILVGHYVDRTKQYAHGIQARAEGGGGGRRRRVAEGSGRRVVTATTPDVAAPREEAAGHPSEVLSLVQRS